MKRELWEVDRQWAGVDWTQIKLESAECPLKKGVQGMRQWRRREDSDTAGFQE